MGTVGWELQGWSAGSCPGLGMWLPNLACPPAIPVPSILSFLYQDTPVSPAPTGATAGGSPPCEESTSDSLNSEPQLSKPGRLVSQLDSEPFSVCSADLAISCPDTLDMRSNNAPEENEYVSVNTLSIHVSEAPSTDNLAGNHGPQAALPLQEEEEESLTLCIGTAPWAPWLGAAAAGALLAVLLAMLYQRRPLR